MNGLEALRGERERIADALRAFDDPVVDEHSGLRLMRSTLEERRDAIDEKITGIEQSTITCELQGSAIDAGGVEADLLVAVLAGIYDAVRAAGLAAVEGLAAAPTAGTTAAACTLHVVESAPSESFQVVLQRPPGVLEAQLVLPDSEDLLVEVAIDAVIDVLDAAADNGKVPDTPAAVAKPLQRLARTLVERAVQLTVSTDPARRDPRSTTLTRAAAQRLSQLSFD